MKKKGIIIVLISIMIVILLIIGLYFYGLTSVSKKSEKVTFTIKPGTSTKVVLNDLYEAKLIKSKISSTFYVKLNSDIVIKAGTYELDRNYESIVRGDEFSFLSNINSLGNEIYLNFVDGIEGYKIEPIIFNSQKENVKNYLVKAYEKYE